MSNLTEYEQGCAHAWDVMRQLLDQQFGVLKRIAPVHAEKMSYPALLSSISFKEAEEMVRKLLPQEGDEVLIKDEESRKDIVGYIMYVLNPNYIRIFIPDKLTSVTCDFPTVQLIKTGKNKRELINQLWDIIEQLGVDSEVISASKKHLENQKEFPF